MKTVLFKIIGIALISFCCGKLSAQEKIEKTNETFSVDKNVSLEVDAKYTQLVFETWNKNEVEVEAFIESEEGFKTEEEKQAALSNWNLEIMGNSEKIKITSQASGMGFHGISAFADTFDENDFAFIGPMMENMMMPMMKDLTAMPILPPSFYENMGGLEFDYEAYKKDSENYLKEYEKQIEEQFGEDFEQKMEYWAEEFSKKMEKRGKLMEKRMQKWSEEYSKKMEARSKRIEERMEKVKERNEQVQQRHQQIQKRHEQVQQRNEQIQERMEKITAGDPNARYSKTVTTTPGGKKVEITFHDSDSWNFSGDATRTLIVRMPKTVVLNLKTRHGKVKIEAANNMTARLSHTPFTATEINGKNTKIHVSYAPVNITTWNYGVLDLGYVSDCSIEQAKSIKLSSNSSDVEIKKLEETGLLSGSFGELSIFRVGRDFKTLRIDLENSELTLQLPETAFDFSYSGSHSEIELPTSLSVQTEKNYAAKFINGYYKSKNNSGKISIDAEFSEVVLKE